MSLRLMRWAFLTTLAYWSPQLTAGGYDIGPLHVDDDVLATLNPPPVVARQVIGDQVWRNGTIITLDERSSIAEAIWIRNDRIEAVGSNKDADTWVQPGTTVIDLDGGVVMPGFVDAHSHFPGGALGRVGADLNSPPIGEMRTVEEAIERLGAVQKRRASVTNLFTMENQFGQGSEWLLGFGYDDTQVDDQRHMTRHDLDRISETEPVYVMHISGHIGYTNSAGLQKLGIDRDTPDPEGGHIGHDENGEPNGILYETAREEVQAQALNFALREQALIVDLAVRQAARNGYTTVQNGQASAAFARSIAAVSRANLIPQRVILWPTRELAEQLSSGQANPLEYSGGRAVLGAVKLVADGSIQGNTGYLAEPYFDPGEEHETSYRGFPTQSYASLLAQVEHFHCDGSQVAIHGNGDAAIEDILNAIEQANAICPREDTRHIIVHAQMARSDQLQRMLRMGVTPSYFAAHVYHWGDRHVRIFMGPERAARMSPMGESEHLGLRYTTHMDTPVVPMQSNVQLWSAADRVSAEGALIGIGGVLIDDNGNEVALMDQRASREGALRAMTSEAAWQNFLEADIGSIEPGKYADFVVSDMNPLHAESNLRDFRVLETWVGGQRIWPAPLAN